MPNQDQPPRRHARWVRGLAAVLVLLGLCSGLGCSDKPTPTGPAKLDPKRRMPR